MTNDEVQLMLYEDAQAWDKWLELMLTKLGQPHDRD